jgi:hypothetical protein
MLKAIITLYEQAQKAISESPLEKKLTWAGIKAAKHDLIQKVIKGKYEVSHK